MRRHRPRTLALLAIAALPLAVPARAPAQAPVTLDSITLAGFRWRSVGPANMSGRITDIEGIPGPSRTFFVAAASGGIWKTTNAGTTFRPVFDNERVVSMGDLAIAPSDTMIVWAGTGEEDSRNSISPGGGVYKSTDGGLTWTLMGLTETQAIGRIVIHPTNPDIVYVAALGAPWNANRERGLYKTADGGKTWQLVKFVSDRAGFVDVAMHPANPDVLFAASWERVRGPYFLRSGGPGSGLWKTTDAGATWTPVRGGGLPETTLGRIGIAIAPSDPRVIYLMVEADTAPNPRPDRSKPGQTRPSGLYRSADGGATWERTDSNNVRPFYYSQVRVDPKSPDRVYWSSTPVKFSDEGGKNARNATVGIHVDHHAMWIDPSDPNHFIVGNDGGVAVTWDKGGNYDVLNTFALGQFYEVSYNMAMPYRVCGGLQDNGSWCGPSRSRRGDIQNVHWFQVNGGDGFFTAQDPVDPDVVWAESQGGNVARIKVRTGERTSLQRPSWRPLYRMFEDSILTDWPDTTVTPPAAVRRRVADLRRRASADSALLDMRWNWNTPFFVSPHSPTTFYAAGNRVVKSVRGGDDLMPISPDLSTRDTAAIRISTRTTGGVTPDVTGAETYGTVVALAESPVRAGLLFAGTDDGNVWLTRNDGGTWENLTGRFPGLPPRTYVARIEPSHFDSAVVYVAFDGHRTGDYAPYLYVSSDFGRSFRSIAGNLPRGGPDYLHVVREDPLNRDLLFAGTDVGAFVSLDRGASWQRFMTGLPTVPVHDLQIHPRDHELIAATHGRSIWIVDIAPLQQLSGDVLAQSPYLFQPTTAYQYGEEVRGGGSIGHKAFRAPSPTYGAAIAYRLTSGEPRAQAQIVITDVRGDTVQALRGPGRPGLHWVTWNFRGRQPPPRPLTPAGRRDSVNAVKRVNVVFDSLIAAGRPAPMMNQIREAILKGDVQGLAQRFGFGGGGGGGGFGGGFGVLPQAQRWVERPGEQAPGRGGGAGGPGGAAAEAQGEGQQAEQAQQSDPSLLQQLAALLRPPGTTGGGGFGGFNALTTALLGSRPPAPFVSTGDYLVTLKVGDRTMSRVLRVERLDGAGVPGFFAGAAEGGNEP
jgi:photosystem II stability/assembly factor-like uncharacterized protein